jgi:hypothetical protein
VLDISLRRRRQFNHVYLNNCRYQYHPVDSNHNINDNDHYGGGELSKRNPG